jgi:hypothetical protein
LELGDGVLEHPLLYQSPAEVQVRRGKTRVQEKGLSMLRDRLIELARVEERVAQIRVDDERERIQLQSVLGPGGRWNTSDVPSRGWA